MYICFNDLLLHVLFPVSLQDLMWSAYFVSILLFKFVANILTAHSFLDFLLSIKIYLFIHYLYIVLSINEIRVPYRNIPCFHSFFVLSKCNT